MSSANAKLPNQACSNRQHQAQRGRAAIAVFTRVIQGLKWRQEIEHNHGRREQIFCSGCLRSLQTRRRGRASSVAGHPDLATAGEKKTRCEEVNERMKEENGSRERRPEVVAAVQHISADEPNQFFRGIYSESGCPHPSPPLNQTGGSHQKSGYPYPSRG